LETSTDDYLLDTAEADPNPAALVAYETDWTSTTKPKTLVIPDCLTDDRLFLIGGSGQTGLQLVTALAITTTAGSTDAWTKPQENLNNPSQEAWITSGVTRVSAAGAVTVQVSPTTTASPAWGFVVVRARGSSGVGVSGFVDSSATQTVTLNPTAGSAVLFASVDFDAGAMGTGYTPAGAAEIERSQPAGAYTVHSALWTGVSAGSVAYGSTGAGGAARKTVGLEILMGTATVASRFRTMRKWR
jgi:hypothetical protein